MKVTVLGKEREYKEGMSLYEISRCVAEEYDCPIILGKINGALKELRKSPKEGDVVEFITLRSEIGNKTYRRGLILVFLKAIYKVLGAKGLAGVHIEHSVGNGT